MRCRMLAALAVMLVLAVSGGMVMVGCGAVRNAPRASQGTLAGMSPELAAALAWIATHQEADGHWDSEKYVGRKPDHAVTSLALLALLYGGNTTASGKYAGNVKRGVKWLISRQRPDGRIGHHAYEAGVTLMTLVEAYERGGRKDARIRQAIRKAVGYAVKTQKAAGGWDYKPDGPFNNTGTSSWWVQGLTAASKNGFKVPAKTLAKARAYFEKATGADGSCSYAGRYRDVAEVKTGGGTPFLSAVAASSLRELGSDRKRTIAAARRRMLRWMPEQDDRDFYFWAWQVWSLRHEGVGAEWRRLKRTVRPIVAATQIRLGTTSGVKGSWDPGADRYGDQWGRVGQTALGAIILAILDPVER